MVNLSFQIRAEGVRQQFDAVQPRIVEAVRRTMDEQHVAQQARIIDKLSGEVLQSHTGELVASVRLLNAVIDASGVEGGVEAGGGTAFYGKFLEDGSEPHIIAPVNAKALAFFPSGSEGAGIGSGPVAQALYQGTRGVNRSIKPGKGPAASGLGGVVVMFVHHPGTKATHFMAGTQDEMKDEEIAAYQEAINDALQPGG